MNQHVNIFPIGGADSPSHEIHFLPSEDAWAMCEVNHEPDFKGVAFHKAAVLALLAQAGAEAIRVYHGHNGHHATLVAFAVDAAGNDLISPNYIAIENGTQCPPFCAKTNVPS